MKRREFVKTCTGAALAAFAPVRLTASEPVHLTSLRDTRIHALALRALDAARTAGARYADVRLTNTVDRTCGFGAPPQSVTLGMSVRSLINGYWGWAATPVLSPAEAVRIGRQASESAMLSARHGKHTEVDLGTIPVVHNGDWTTPVVTDPFDVPVAEVSDWAHALAGYVRDLGVFRGDAKAGATLGMVPGGIGASFYKQERLFASTEGSLLTQTVIITRPQVGFIYRGITAAIPQYNFPVQAGWERITETPIPELIRQTMEQMDDDLAHPLPTKPVEIGRYDLVFSANAMATLLHATLAPATELDRAMGYEANADGTSYLGPHPLSLVGTPVASPLVTLTADRSTPTALATVKWDDEGVAPANFDIIKDGVLVDYQTTREQAAWLTPWYKKAGVPVQSHGCAMATDALAVPMQHTPNLRLQPGAVDQGVEDLIAGLDHGLLIDGLEAKMDFQCNNGEGLLRGVTEIRTGKRIARVTGAGVLFQASEFWKHLQALGGAKSVRWISGFSSRKGEPGQNTLYSIGAVPAVVTQQAIIDPKRKA